MHGDRVMRYWTVFTKGEQVYVTDEVVTLIVTLDGTKDEKLDHGMAVADKLNAPKSQ